MSKKTKPVTAIEFVTQLQSDSAFVARKEDFEEKRKQNIERNRIDSLPILEELKQAGFITESLDKLKRSGIDYKSAVPILLKWLPLISNPNVKKSIVRTVTIPQAKLFVAPILISEFLNTSDASSSLKWALGSALGEFFHDNFFDQLCELALNPKHGRGRQMIVLAFGKAKSPKAVDVLIELLNDEDVSGHAVKALAKLKAPKARPYLERFLNDSRAWVRKQASKALVKLDNG